MNEVCVCGHALDQHGGDPKYPGSTACTGEVLSSDGNTDEPCDCIAYEADEDDG